MPNVYRNNAEENHRDANTTTFTSTTPSQTASLSKSSEISIIDETHDEPPPLAPVPTGLQFVLVPECHQDPALSQSASVNKYYGKQGQMAASMSSSLHSSKLKPSDSLVAPSISILLSLFQVKIKAESQHRHHKSLSNPLGYGILHGLSCAFVSLFLLKLC